jgi:methylenetetrahydrofolate reductase (NADPH)
VGAERIGIEHATRQCEDLLRAGAPGVHFYTLNQSRATEEIFRHLKDKVAGLMP